TPKDLDYISIARDPSQNRAAQIAYVLRNPISGGKAAMEHFRRAKIDLGITDMVAETFDMAPEMVKAKVVNVEHHLSHIASSYYCSPYEGLTAGFSYDGSGDFTSAMAARCEGSRIEILDRVNLPSSMGFFYTACCQYIGFDGYGEE